MVIEWYIPARHKSKEKWVPPSQRGKILPFKLPDKQAPGELLARLRELAYGNQHNGHVQRDDKHN